MAHTLAQIYGLALSRIGVRKLVTSPAEDSPEVNACARVYPTCRDYLLDIFPWPFARRTVALALVEEEPDDGTDWGYSYRYPSNCLKVRRILSAVGVADPSPPPFEIGSDDQGLLVFTDEAEPTVEITSRFDTTTSFFPPSFVDCLAWRLAAEIAFPLTATQAIVDSAARFYRLSLEYATGAARNESHPEQVDSSEFSRARE